MQKMKWKITDILAILTIAGGVFTFGFSAFKDKRTYATAAR